MMPHSKTYILVAHICDPAREKPGLYTQNTPIYITVYDFRNL